MVMLLKCGKKEPKYSELQKAGSLSLRKKVSLKGKDRRGSQVFEASSKD